MFHYFGTVTNTRGDSLPNWQLEVVQLSDGETVVPIYADENQTPIATVSGIANRALSDANGNYDFFVPSGTYSLRFYDSAGVFQRTLRYLPMYGAPVPVAVSEQTSTSYTLTLNDVATVLVLTNASPITLTIPPESSVDIPVGSGIEIHQGGAGGITFTAGAGVTLNTRGALNETAGLHAIAGLRKTAADTWVLTGDLV